MTLTKINLKLDTMAIRGLNVPSIVIRVSDIDDFHTRDSLAGIKFIIRSNGFDLDFETFKEVQVWFKGLMEDHIQLLEDEIDTIKEFLNK